MNKIKEVLEGIYNNKELRQRIVPLFIGSPGLGKTMVIEQFAKEKGVNLIEMITSQMSPFEISGICVPDKDTKQMMYYNLDRLENLKDGDILFFDELLNGNPVVLNACLTILEQRRLISGKSLPDIMIVAAANPQGQTPLTPQIKRRFVWYDVKFDTTMWKNYMFDKFKMPDNISSKLCNLIKNETFNGYNFNTPADLDKAVNTIIHNVPTPYSNEIKPILDTLIKNELGEVDLGNGEILQENEQLSWLKLIQLLKNVNIQVIKNNFNNIISNDYEIIIEDKNGNIIGEIKDVTTLLNLYYFSNEDVENLNKGNKISPNPLLSASFLFFKKN
jgi:hypothetical protein